MTDNPWQRFDIQLDHLVVGTASLDDGTAWLERLLGARLEPGGRHTGRGTYNRLLQLGGGTYLELIAPDPEQPEPSRPRAFGLDRPDVAARVAERPRLLHYVMRTDAIEDAAGALGYDPGPVARLFRGALQWRLTVPANGDPACEGALPALIQWDVDLETSHPASVLEPRGVALERLVVEAPQPVIALLAGIDSRIEARPAPQVRLSARLSTPNGPVTID